VEYEWTEPESKEKRKKQIASIHAWQDMPEKQPR
jgi:hypothetical protein